MNTFVWYKGLKLSIEDLLWSIDDNFSLQLLNIVRNGSFYLFKRSNHKSLKLQRRRFISSAYPFIEWHNLIHNGNLIA